MATVAPYGSWTSNITPDTFAKGNCKGIIEVQATTVGVYWVEQNCVNGKRDLFFQSRGDDKRVRWAPEQSVQNCVHEYGGGSLSLAPEGGIVFTTVEGVFEQKTADDTPKQVAEAKERKLRYADCSVTPTHIFCVYEEHKEGHVVDNYLASINRSTKDLKVIASGCDFFACPRVSKDFQQLVWMQWNHCNMPWDETTIMVANIQEDGTLTNETTLRDGVGKNINYHCPQWATDGSIFLSHDSTGIWNLYNIDMKSEKKPETNVLPSRQEIGIPLWNFGFRCFATNASSVVFCAGNALFVRKDENVRRIDTPDFTAFSQVSLTDDDQVYCVAAGPTRASTLIRISLNSDKKDEVFVIRSAIEPEDLAIYDISIPRPIEFVSDGVSVTGFFYPPQNKDYKAPDGDLPPVMLLGHGGPTAAADDTLDLKKQFFTNRGFAVFDINYRGSTGYGSEFRNALKGQWGIVDRNDMINGAKALIDLNLVDANKVCIKGSSAGGYLLLSALIHSDVFKAAVSAYGVSDLVGLAEDSHKFELGYNSTLIAPWPKERHVFEERSPFNHIEKITTPIGFLHGKEDTVVPCQQSIDMFNKLKERGVTTAIKLYENEGHGFRGSEAVKNSVENTYYFLCKAMHIKPSVESSWEIQNLSE